MGRERRRCSGLTMVELLVVVAIVGIAAGGSVLRLPRVVEAVRLETALHQLGADLGQARTLAVASARHVRLVLREGGTSYARQSAAAGAFQLDRTRRLPAGIRIALVGSGGTLTFSPLGDAENATIVLESRAGTRRALVINQRGRVRVLEPR